ncbi:MAG: permease [Armatimonadota bacterium]|nr:MAG: permease [Armatimonadota bacterium]
MGTLGDAVNVFTCCVFTWNLLSIVLPAFLVAGALVVFVPSYAVMKYLGPRANRIISYGVAAVSGNVLTVCSCNVVPIFAGILRRGAGIGPAFCFVFAAPAIHIVNTVVTYQVIGAKLAFWRFFTVPIIAAFVGLAMALVFRREDQARRKESDTNPVVALVEQAPGQARRAAVFFLALIGVLVFGAWTPLDEQFAEGIGQFVRMGGVVLLVAALTWLALRWFGNEETLEWARQTWLLLRMILPIFIPAVLAIGLLVSFVRIPVEWISPTAAELSSGQVGFKFGHPHGNAPLPVLLAAVFATLMYFPMLTEVIFAKGLLLQQFALGPALALLLGGPGLSLPGLLLVTRVAGWRKTVAYWVVMVLLITVVAYFFGSYYGEYLCPCQQRPPAF